MANFFSLQDGNLTDSSVYGYSLTGAEVMNNTTGVWLGTTDAYSPTFRGDGTSISAVAIHLSAREANGTLILKLSSVSSVITETYAISSFTSFNGSNNLLTPYPQNWQILKLTNPYALPNLSSAAISLATLSANTLALMCSATNNNYDKAILKINTLTPVSSDGIHIGGALKGLFSESRTITARTSSFNNLYIHNRGTLNFPLTSNITLTLNGSVGLQITSDGTLNIGTSSSFVPLSTTHTINLSNTQIDVHNGGNLNVYGYPELTTTNLVSTTPLGSRTFTTTNNVSSDWKIGDTLVFKPNLSARTSFDTLILSSFTGSNRFTTTSNSLCTHTGSADAYSFIPDIYNITRNINIQGLSNSARGSIRTIDAAKTYINYAQLSNFGINTLNKTGFVLGTNSLGLTRLSGTVINSDNTSTVNNISPLTGRILQNIIINNNIINKSNTITISSLSVTNIVISNNHILSSGGTGLNLTNLSGSINMSNNTTIGSLSYGAFISNNSLTGTYGTSNYNSALQGMLISGINTGTIVGGSINSSREGIYINASSSNLSGLSFQNVLVNNNSLVGFKLSSNDLNYLNPVILNINGLTANNNNDSGFEGYNIVGNLDSAIIDNNYIHGIKTSIGNGSTNFNRISVLNNSLAGSVKTVTKKGNPLLSPLSPFGSGIDGSIYLNGTTDYITISSTPDLNLDTADFTIECWLYHTSRTSYSNFLSKRINSSFGSGFQFFITATTGVVQWLFGTTNNDGWGGLLNATGLVVPLSTWTHVAAVRRGNTIFGFVNGLSSNTNGSISYTHSINTGNTPILIGAQDNSSFIDKFPGYISNIRIVKGTALYTSNFNLSLPVSPATPLKIVPNTSLLYSYPYSTSYSNASSTMYGINILSGYNYSNFTIRNSLISSYNPEGIIDYGLVLDSTRFSRFSLDNCSLSVTTPLQINTTRNILEGSYLFNNTNLGSITFINLNNYQSNVSRSTGFAFTNYNKISGNHFTYLPMGIKSRDTSLYDSFTSDLVSERLTPTSKTTKLCSGSKYVALNSGDSTLIKTNVLVSSAYNGNAPRLMLKRNPAAGVYSDTVLGSSNLLLGYDVFNQIIGTQTISVIDDAVLEFYVDCDGTAGYVCVDTWFAN